MTDPTPVRALGERTPEGWVLLRDSGSSYRDGAEERLFEIVAGAEDLRSDSDELFAQARGWAETYHLDPDRSNVLRGLQIPPGAHVLEIGAGCGAVTRYLGEVAAVVDAVEPVPARARVARARTRDLPGVEVFVGSVDDVPLVPAYDLVVVVGVLEYVGSGAADHAPYLEFLRSIEARLVDGGTLALAIENKLGVKYLAGAPEDHTNRVFDSLEDYPYGGHARTFDRVELESMITEAGLVAATLGVFPDYKMTRAVLDPTFFADDPAGLASSLPSFPSPDHLTHRARLADEGSLWRAAVRAGLGAELPNSFLVLAGKGARSPLWPRGRGGVYHSLRRRSPFRVDAELRVGERWEIERRVRHPGEEGNGQGLRVLGSVEPVAPGTDLVQWAGRAGDDDLAVVLVDWVADVREAAAGGLVSPDRIPHNLVIAPHGTWTLIDQEWAPFLAPEAVVDRGLLWLAQRVAMRTSPVRWPVGTVRELAGHLRSLAGLDDEDGWLDRAVEVEAGIQATVLAAPEGLSDEEHIARQRAQLVEALDRDLWALPLGLRAPEQLDRFGAELVDVRRHADELAEETQALRSEAEETAALTEQRVAALRGSLTELGHRLVAESAARASAEAELGRVLGSTTWRVARRLSSPIARLVPVGSRRRRALVTLARAVAAGRAARTT